MFTEAIMLEARVLTMPPETSAHRLLVFAQSTSCHLESWGTRVRQLRLRLGDLPDILCGSASDLEACARGDKSARKTMLAKYHREIVYPAVEAFDENNLDRAAESNDWPYPAFGCIERWELDSLLCVQWNELTWKSFRLWSAARCTGRFPLPLLGFDFFPSKFALCPLCNMHNDDLAHVLMACACTQAHREGHDAPAGSWDELRFWIFTSSGVVDDEGQLADRITFFASIMSQIGESLRVSDQDIEVLLGQATGGRV